jgi:hypothetical protein
MALGWRFGLAVAVGLACCAAGSPFASAQQNIGSAAAAHNDVTRELAGTNGRLAEGDSVFRDESVRTGSESTAKLVFLDSTSLAVGPISRVVLDRFVYDPNPTSQTMAISLAKGVFRFTTGVLDKNAYSITTPTASIGVRGTVLDIRVEAARSRVTLVEGRALVCPRRKGETFEHEARACARDGASPARGRRCECVVLDQPGQTASVVATKGGPSAMPTGAAVQFASLCAQDPQLCTGAQFAGGGPQSAGWSPGALCGR